jgi:RNA polymerase sigma-70 factor (ECF subfamily)
MPSRGLSDTDALRVVSQYEPALRRLAASYESDPSLVEDLLQEILFAIVRAFPAWRRECSERTFVYRVAHNRAMTHRTRRPPRGDDLDRASRVADPSASPEEAVSARQRRDALFAALRSLPIAQRQLLSMALEGLVAREIAEVLGITENNVAVRLSRARASLREALAPKETP